jgi:diacylglycerol kinase (ATP)
MSSPYKNPTGWVHVLYGIRHGMAGLRAAWHYEDAFRQEIFVACCALPIVYFCPVSLVGKVLMVASLLLVLIVELLNSAVEAAVDHTSLARHHLAKRAKDIASAAVLLSIANATVVWAMLLYGT